MKGTRILFSVFLWALIVATVFGTSPKRPPPSREISGEDCNDSADHKPPINRRCKKKHEVWLPCGKFKDCAPTCGKLYKKCKKVEYVRCPDGCQCMDNYARDPDTGNCVPVKQCPDYRPTCGKNEVYKEKGYKCSESCDETLCQRVRQIPVDGCFCKENYARDDNGKCVPREKCHECPKRMTWNKCGNACTDDCNREVMKCTKECKPGCYCEEPYRRNNDDECVRKNQCK